VAAKNLDSSSVKAKTFDAELTIPLLAQMWATVQLAAQDRMVPADEYVRAAIAVRLAKDGYLPVG
jgi:hypothetical protein